MQPIVSTKGKSTQLRYELPQRVHDSTVYPAKAPNGSTIILYGHENGVGILWRGGRPLKKSVLPSQAPSKAPPKVNGTKNAIVIIDSDDDEPAKAASQPPPKAEFEEEEEELDPDHPYPSIAQQLRLSLNTEVLHIAIPQVPVVSELRPSETVPPVFKQKMIFAVACADYTVRIITLPLNPPPDAAKERPANIKSPYGEEIVKIPTYAGHQTIPTGVSVTWTSRAEPSPGQPSEDEMEVDGDGDSAAGRRSPRKRLDRSRSATGKDAHEFDLLVASHSSELGGLLKIWRFNLTETSVKATNPISAYQTLTLQKPASKVAFNTAQYPKRRHSQLLITDSAGAARIYDPFAPRKRSLGNSTTGAFVALFRTRFEHAKSSTMSPPILASRKPILDAAWTSDGHSILALLANGEWGIWDVERIGQSQPTDPSGFALRNFVGTSDVDKTTSGASSPKRSGRSSLVPMTPNTRRRKEETLFQGSSSSSIPVPVRGGVSVASLPSSNGAAAEDSIVIWYGKEVYRLPDLAKYRARIASSSNGSSLPAPGFAQIQDVHLLGESITAVSQFDTTAREARLAVPRGVLLSAEHRLIIVASTNQAADRHVTSNSAREQAEEESTRRTDQALLARGELDLGGMDRVLDSMGEHGTLTLGNPRKVLFASSTS